MPEKDFDPVQPSPKPWLSPRLMLLAILLGLPLLLCALVFADWYRTIGPEAKATYVGKQSCVKCHQQQHDDWHGSHHDLAMDVATDDTVLGNFNDEEFEHYDVKSRMFKRDGKFFVNTEGESGEYQDYEVKWVFGVEPLQQYLVELKRPANAEENEIGHVQVLPVAWDTTRGEWYYLDPPDVYAKLEPGDRLHWTSMGQNWNRNCADCHSTNLQKNFNDKTGHYHTTFTDIDVSCEACHGPGSLHVELAERTSLFWDRERGYALPKLKGGDGKMQVETCARCHVRRERVVAGDYEGGEPFYDYFCNALIRQGAYHADGQIRDEVYVHGSFLQSKMYHKGVRCSDCHDPHTTKLKFEDNRLCTSCHEAHPAGKYDTPAHHHHQENSRGSLCVECHMPESTYMEVDPRRDHSIRVPRPDLSVAHGTPNACTGCHLDAEKLSPKAKQGFAVSHTRNPLGDYASWLRTAAEAEDEAARTEVQAEIDRVNQWALEHTRKWYGKKTEGLPHWTPALANAWQGLPKAEAELRAVVRNKDFPAMARASALAHLYPFENEATTKVAKRALSDDDPLARFAAIGYFERQVADLSQTIRDSVLEAEEAENEARQMERALAGQEFNNPQTAAFVQQRIGQIRGRVTQAKQQAAQAEGFLNEIAPSVAKLLDDPVRLVRTEAGRVLAPVDGQLLDGKQRRARDAAIEEYVAGRLVDNDWAVTHLQLGDFYAQTAQSPDEYAKAAESYRRAMRVEPDVTGPRSHLAALLDRMARTEDDPAKVQKLVLEGRELRRKESDLLKHEAELLPDVIELQYRYAASLVQIEDYDTALEVLTRIRQRAPTWLEPVIQMIVVHRARDEWEEAVQLAGEFVRQNPDNEMARLILREIQTAAAQRRGRP